MGKKVSAGHGPAEPWKLRRLAQRVGVDGLPRGVCVCFSAAEPAPPSPPWPPPVPAFEVAVAPLPLAFFFFLGFLAAERSVDRMAADRVAAYAVTAAFPGQAWAAERPKINAPAAAPVRNN